jgi:hypothetical protein
MATEERVPFLHHNIKLHKATCDLAAKHTHETGKHHQGEGGMNARGGGRGLHTQASPTHLELLKHDGKTPQDVHVDGQHRCRPSSRSRSNTDFNETPQRLGECSKV